MKKAKSNRKHRAALMKAYRRALHSIGPRNWWPGDTPFEIAVGAILTQNTAWKNVEKAMTHLKNAKILHEDGIREISEKKLASLIRPSGYFNMKAKKLKAFTTFLFDFYDGQIENIKKTPLKKLREQLLEVYGIGPETADSILLYTAQKPSFVVDTYTRRIFSRHNLFHNDVTYEEMRELFMENLQKRTSLYNEYHALIVYIGHHYCKKTPRCNKCPWNWIEF